MLEHRLRPSADEPEGALLLLHGRGTSEHDLFPLLDALDPDRLLVGITPRGPLSLPPGGSHWYVVEQVGFPDRETFESSLRRAADFLDGLGDATGVALDRTVVGGFSQGAVMSYALALGADRPRPAGILGMSGFIPTVDGFDLDLTGLDGYPVAITHGSLDPVIDVEFSRSARERLESAGADVRYREAPIGHQIEPSWIPELAAWVRDTLSATRGVS